MTAQLGFAPCFIPSQFHSFKEPIRRVEKCSIESCHGELKFKKVLILLRGLPGSGKSTLAQVLHEVLGACVTSADDHFLTSANVYQYDQSRVGEAHEACQTKARTWMSRGMQFVAVDNTNATALEMEPYVRMAMKYDYHILLLEPNTPWKNDVCELARRNVHQVSQKKIQLMKRRFEKASQVNECFAIIRRQSLLSKKTNGVVSTSTPTFSMNKTLCSTSNTTETIDSYNSQIETLDFQAYQLRINDPFSSNQNNYELLASNEVQNENEISCDGSTKDLESLIHMFPQLQIEQIQELYSMTYENYDHTMELLQHTLPIQDSDTNQVSMDPVSITETSIAEHVTTVNMDNNLKLGIQMILPSEVTQETNVVEASEIFHEPLVNLKSVLLESDAVVRTSSEEVSESFQSNEMFIAASTGNSLAQSCPTTSTDLSLPFLPNGSEGYAPIHLSRGFLHDAQNRFGLELGLQQVDVDYLPPEIYESWCPPPHIAKLIYSSFMESLGVLPASRIHISEMPVDVNVSTIERHRCHSEGETVRGNISVPPKPSTFAQLNNCATTYCQYLNDIASCLPFRELMDIDLALERSIQDQLPWLNQVSSRMKLRLLKEMFPNIEMNHLEALCVQFNFSTAALLDHLLGIGHVPNPTQGFSDAWSTAMNSNNDDDPIAAVDPRLAFLLGGTCDISNSEEAISLLKQRLEEERERRSYLQRKMQEAFSRKSPSGVAHFYQSELSTSNNFIIALEKRIASKTVEARRTQEGVNRLDIHHLNIRNAMEQVKIRIEEIRLGSSNGVRQTLTILTGRGLHSIGPARLRPAVKKFLSDNNYKYQEPSDGHFVVSLR